jgi:hypothetical protein
MNRLSRKNEHRTRNNVWFVARFPGCLLLAAVVAAAFPANAVFIGAAAVGSAVSLAAIWIFVFREKQFRISWILGDGLLLGYSLGSFNSALRLALEGSTAAIQFGRPQEQLSRALAATLLVSAVLFILGAVAEKPIRVDARRLERSDLRFVWLGLAVVLAAFATGEIGFKGTIADDQHRVSILGTMAGLFAPALPAVTVFLFPKCLTGFSRVACWLLLSMSFVCLVPQGRGVMLYAVLLALVAFGVTAGGGRRFGWKYTLLIVAAFPLLYAGNRVFYAMRISSWQNGKARLDLTELTTRSIGLLRGGRDASFDQQIDENLRDRTFILSYFSDLLEASWSHEPLYGRDLLFCFEEIVPSILYPDKEDVRQIGMEENLANPNFGLVATDEANSILTTGVSDFGIVGVFVYPIALGLLMGCFIRGLARHLPEIVKVIAVILALYAMWRPEVSATIYFSLCRDTVLVSLPLTLLKLWERIGRKRRSRRLKSPSTLAAAPYESQNSALSWPRQSPGTTSLALERN